MVPIDLLATNLQSVKDAISATCNETRDACNKQRVTGGSVALCPSNIICIYSTHRTLPVSQLCLLLETLFALVHGTSFFSLFELDIFLSS